MLGGMKKLWLSCIVVLSLGEPAAYAADIFSCGYLTQPNTTYVLQNDVSSDGTCFFITADSVTLDLNGHTVTYDDASPIVVTNGDFETEEGWDFFTAPNAAIVSGTYVKPVTLYSGSSSLRFTVPNADQSVRSTSPIQLQPNTTYTLSAMAYNMVNDPLKLYVQLEGTTIRAEAGRTWRGFGYISVRFTTGSNPDPVTVIAGITGGSAGGVGAVYMDDIRIQRTRFAGVAVGPAAWQGQNIISDVTQFGNANNATIRNGTIEQGKGTSDWSNCITVMENSGTGWSIHDLTLRAHGANSKAISSTNGRNAQIHNNHIYNPQRAITSRDAFHGAAVKVEYPGSGMVVSNNIIYQGVQTGFCIGQIAGQPQNEVSGNTISLQSRYTNDFAIVAGGAKIYGNTIDCGSGNNSCRGIGIGGTGTLIYNNTITVQELSKNQEYNGCMLGGAYGIQMEANNQDMNMYGNIITANAGICEAFAFRANPKAEGGTSSANNAVHDNTFIAIASGTSRAGTIKYSGVTGTDVNVYNNIFRTNHRWIYVDGGSVINPNFNGNRWETTGTLLSPFYPFEVYTWGDTHFTGTVYNNTYGEGDKERFESEYFRTANGAADPLSSLFVAYDALDTEAPAVSITSLADGHLINGMVQVMANATDNARVSKVEIYLNNILRATTTGSSCNYSWDTTQDANGSYIVVAKAYDDAGNIGYSIEVAVYVSNGIVTQSAKVSSMPAVTYFKLQSAYNAAVNGDVIRVAAHTFREDILLDRNIAVDFSGGYDNSFTTPTSVTTVIGSVTIRNGAVTIDRLAVM